ncbi:MAG TPA: hypothetical protein VKQ30_16295 [Ktedonobacterales bacterium]|nr:hypothetical protein [Ktedonobacterales bacterium]
MPNDLVQAFVRLAVDHDLETLEFALTGNEAIFGPHLVKLDAWQPGAQRTRIEGKLQVAAGQNGISVEPFKSPRATGFVVDDERASAPAIIGGQVDAVDGAAQSTSSVCGFGVRRRPGLRMYFE